MKIIITIILLSIPALLMAQDSVKVFVIGNMENESYRFYYDHKRVLDFKTNYSYKYSFNILRDTSFKENESVLENIGIERKFGSKYRKITVTIIYENKKYLVIKRDIRFKDIFSMNYFWTDKEPKAPYGHP